MIRPGPAPMRRAAWANSSSRKERTFERTARARPVQSTSPRMSVMPKKTHRGSQVTGSTALSESHKGIIGKLRTISIRRWMMVSVQPP